MAEHSAPHTARHGAGVLEDCQHFLRSVITSRIVPQLVRDHPLDHASSHDSGHATGHAFDASRGVGMPLPTELASAVPVQVAQDVLPEVAEFARVCCTPQEAAAWAVVQRWRDERSVDEVLLSLITPAARHLGDLWVQDRLDFSAVTLGVLRMQRMVHQLGFETQPTAQVTTPMHQPHVMVACLPGTDHLLGLTVLSSFFVSDGWRVSVEVPRSEAALCAAVSAQDLDVLALSVGLREQRPLLPALLARLRAQAQNPQLLVLLGGAAFTGQGPELAANPADYGADAVCLDAPGAVALARARTKISTLDGTQRR